MDAEVVGVVAAVLDGAVVLDVRTGRSCSAGRTERQCWTER